MGTEDKLRIAEERRKNTFRQVVSEWLKLEEEPKASSYDRAFALSEVMLVVTNVSEQKIRAWCAELGFSADKVLDA